MKQSNPADFVTLQDGVRAVIDLSDRPAVFEGTKIKSLIMREPSAAEIAPAKYGLRPDFAQAEAELLATLADIDLSVITKLPRKVYFRLSYALLLLKHGQDGQDPGAFVSYSDDGSATISFADRPLPDSGGELESVALREPLVEDELLASKMARGDPFETKVMMLANICTLSPESMRSAPAALFARFEAALEGFSG